MKLLYTFASMIGCSIMGLLIGTLVGALVYGFIYIVLMLASVSLGVVTIITVEFVLSHVIKIVGLSAVVGFIIGGIAGLKENNRLEESITSR